MSASDSASGGVRLPRARACRRCAYAVPALCRRGGGWLAGAAAAILVTALWPVSAWGGEVEEPATRTAMVAAVSDWRREPGMGREVAAQKLELRDELLAAQMEYAAALRELLAAMGTGAGGQAKPRSWFRCVFLVEKLCELARVTGEVEDAERLLGRVAAQLGAADAPGAALLAARATWLRARLLLARGGATAARAAADTLGMIRGWCVLGPFADERGRGFDAALPPERVVPDLQATFAGKRRRVAWRVLDPDLVSPLGFLRLGELLSPNTECLAYACALVHCGKATGAVLRLGASNAVAAWVNLRRVARVPARGESARQRPAGLDQEAIGVVLRRGWNLLLVKSSQARGAWSICARLTDTAGRPLPGLKYASGQGQVRRALRLVASGGDGKKEASAPAADRGLLSILGRGLQEDDAPARLFYYAGYLVMRRGLGGARRAQRRLLEEATRRSPTTAAFYLALAHAYAEDGRSRPDREENLQRLCLERTRNLDREAVAATVMLARYYLRALDNQHRAEELADAALAANPMSPHALLLQARLCARRGWKARALGLARRLARVHASMPEANLYLGRLELRRGHTRVALERLRAARARDFTSVDATDGLVTALCRLGRVREAREVLTAFLRASPGSYWARRRQADLRYAQAGAKGAWPEITARLRACPDDFRALAFAGRCLRALGREQEARAAWRHALEVRPSYPALERYLEFIDDSGEAGGGAERRQEEARLAELARNSASYRPPAGHPFAYLLREETDRVNAGGTRTRRVHLVARVLDRAGVDDLQRRAVFFDEGIERARVRAARVRHVDGSVAEARVSAYHGDKRSPLLIEFPALARGDVVEIDYQVERFRPDFFGDYFGKVFSLQTNVPTRLARYRLQSKAGMDFYFHRRGAVGPARVRRDGELVTRTWEMRNLPALRREPYMPPPLSVCPVIQVSTFRDWNDLARWYWRLVQEQHLATPAIKRKLGELTRGLPDDRAKLAAVYRWVTRNIHNEAWEFGVHGYKPYNAHTIFSRGFGDCKDKATLICVMARELGLEAWPVLLWATDPSDKAAGRAREDLSLPLLSHFNHCIAAVIARGNTWFLDGTVLYRELESIPITDAGASAVMITASGARRLRIPAQRAGDNLWDDDLDVALDRNGYADLTQRLIGRGQVAVFLRAYFQLPLRVPERMRRLTWEGMMRRAVRVVYGDARVAAVSFREQGVGTDTVRLDSRLRVRSFARVDGRRMYLRLPRAFLRGKLGPGAALPGRMRVFAAHSAREHDLALPLVFRVSRRINISWPEGWRLLGRPRDCRLRGEFGAFEFSSDVRGDSLAVTYLLEVRQAMVARQFYRRFRRMCVLADQVDDTVLVLERER